jgi:hypothetical protein
MIGGMQANVETSQHRPARTGRRPSLTLLIHRTRVNHEAQRGDIDRALENAVPFELEYHKHGVVEPRGVSRRRVEGEVSVRDGNPIEHGE